jgi:hypothetical protein
MVISSATPFLSIDEVDVFIDYVNAVDDPGEVTVSSLCQDWVIYGSVAFLGCGSRLSGRLSGIRP